MILLASRSPQRAALLRAAGLPFEVVPSTCDEAAIIREDPIAQALARARAKVATAVLPAVLPVDAVVLGADTLVSAEGHAIGQPVDRADARRLLGRLQGTTHTIVTAHAACRPGQADTMLDAVDHTTVCMRPMTAAAIAAYVDSGESDGKAGAYALQDGADAFVERIDGARDTVIGLHIACVLDLLRRLLAGDGERWSEPRGHGPGGPRSRCR
jgi:septum formation protein